MTDIVCLKGRLPAVAQLLETAFLFLGAGSHLCPPWVLLVPEG